MARIKKIETIATLVQTCANCGDEFESATPRIYCSYECEQEAAFKVKEAARIEAERKKAEADELAQIRTERDKVIKEDAREVAVLVRELTIVHGFQRHEALSVLIGWMSGQSIKRMSVKE